MPEPKRILLLTTDFDRRDTLPFLEAAEKLGLLPIIGTERVDHIRLPWREDALTLRFDTRDTVLSIIDYAQPNPVAAVVPLDGRPVTVAARAGSMLGLCWHPPKAADACTEPETFAARMSTAGIGLTDKPSMLVSAFMDAGRIRVLGVFDARDPERTLPLTSETGQRLLAGLRQFAEALALRHGPFNVTLDIDEHALRVAGVSLAASTPTWRHRYKIPLVDEDMSYAEVALRNALELDISRVFLKST